ncbi:MAG: flagellin [Acidobacteriota bacterium]|nr:flagellin [Acidobacteriota bacterium]
MPSILNNIGAIGASRQLGITNAGLQQTIQRLTTGKRINQASDDAAGLAISNKLNADIQIAGQAQRNTNDGTSYLQVADGVLDTVTNLLTRAAQLAQQAQTGTVDTTGRASLDAEFQNIIATINNIQNNTVFSGTSVFSSNVLAIAAGGFGTVTVSVNTFNTLLAGGTTSLQSVAGAAAAATSISAMLTSVSALRGAIGASEQELSAISSTLGIQVQNFTAAYSQITDANVADEVVNLSKYQILNQSGISALSQANQAGQSILALLR